MKLITTFPLDTMMFYPCDREFHRVHPTRRSRHDRWTPSCSGSRRPCGRSIQRVGRGDRQRVLAVPCDGSGECVHRCGRAGDVRMLAMATSSHKAVVVNRHLASVRFGWSIRPCPSLGMPSPETIGWPMAGSGCTLNAPVTKRPRHRAAALSVLRCEGERGAVAKAVSAAVCDELSARSWMPAAAPPP